MLQLDLDLNLNAAIAFLSNLSRRHIPFAAARALSAVAAAARDAVRMDMPHRFSVRRPWIIRGIGSERATKSNLEAAVFSRDMFMANQEAGGTRTGTQTIPVGRMAGIHATRAIPKSQLPAALKARKNVFYRAGSLFERRGNRIESLYIFRKRACIAPRFGMSMTVQSVVLRCFGGLFKNELHAALSK